MFGHLTNGHGVPIWDKDCEICQREEKENSTNDFPKVCKKHGVVHKNGGYPSCPEKKELQNPKGQDE